MAEGKQSDAWIISFIDLFVNGIGCVLLLMSLGVLKAPVRKGGPAAGPDALPVMVTLAWGPEAAPAVLDLRLLRQEGSAFRELPAQEYQRLDLRGRGASEKAARGGGKLLQFDVQPGAVFQIQVRGGVEPPVLESLRNTSAYEQMVRAVMQGWQEFAEAPDRREELLARLRKVSTDYLRLVKALDELRREWRELERHWRETPADPDSRFTDIVGERLRLTRTVLRTALDERWSYPSEEFYQQYRQADGALLVVEFESRLTRLLLNERPTRGDPLAGQREQWVAGQVRLLDPGFELPLAITLSAPGAKELMDKPSRLKNLFQAPAETHPWRSLALVKVDARGQVTVEWDANLVPDEEKPREMPTPDTPRQPEEPDPTWEVVFRTFEGEPGEESLLERIDQALGFLAQQQQQATGEFTTVGARHGGLNGPAITGLCLLAFLGRGHLVNQEGSQYRTVTRRAVENLIKTLPELHGKEGIGLYHQGFGTIALAQALPGVRRNGPPALADRCASALRQSVDAIIGGQGPTGGWGYTPARDDSSVAAVMVKALSDARPFLSVEQKGRVNESLTRAGKFFAACYQPEDGVYRYRLGTPAGHADSKHRQGGCMLAQHLIASRDQPPGARTRFPELALKRLREWKPDPKAIEHDGFCHYALFYNAHAILHAEGGDSAAWFRWSKQFLREVGQHRAGDFGGNTYGTAMAVILLTLPARHELQGLSRR